MQQGDGFLAQALPGGRQGDTAAGAVEQAYADFLFQPDNRAAQMGLCHADLLRSPAEMQGLGNGQEKLQLLEFH